MAPHRVIGTLFWMTANQSSVPSVFPEVASLSAKIGPVDHDTTTRNRPNERKIDPAAPPASINTSAAQSGRPGSENPPETPAMHRRAGQPVVKTTFSGVSMTRSVETREKDPCGFNAAHARTIHRRQIGCHAAAARRTALRAVRRRQTPRRAVLQARPRRQREFPTGGAP